VKERGEAAVEKARKLTGGTGATAARHPGRPQAHHFPKRAHVAECFTRQIIKGTPASRALARSCGENSGTPIVSVLRVIAFLVRPLDCLRLSRHRGTSTQVLQSPSAAALGSSFYKHKHMRQYTRSSFLNHCLTMERCRRAMCASSRRRSPGERGHFWRLWYGTIFSTWQHYSCAALARGLRIHIAASMGERDENRMP
jgi:hypothetical protein